MLPLPEDLLASLPKGSETVAQEWWTSLSEENRLRIGQLWDERWEVRFFTPQANEAGCVDDWEHVPEVEGGRFIPSDNDGRKEWQPGYFEHLLQHPELVLAYEPEHRVFHICTQHPAAQTCLAQGHVPFDFACPLNESTCPMVPLRGGMLKRPTP